MGREWGVDTRPKFILLIWTLRMNLPGGSSLTQSPRCYKADYRDWVATILDALEEKQEKQGFFVSGKWMFSDLT